MATATKPQHNSKHSTTTATISNTKHHLNKSANQLLKDGKKLATKLYADGWDHVETAEDSVKEYSDQLVKKVQKNPVSSVLIAGGIGFLLSLLLKK